MAKENRSLLSYNEQFVDCFSIASDRNQFRRLRDRDIENKNIVQLW